MKSSKSPSSDHPGATVDDRVNVSLYGLGSAVRALARQRRISITALMKSALLPLLGDVSGDASTCAQTTTADDHEVVRVGVRMQRRHATLLTRRARVSGMTQGEYLGALLDTGPPPELPSDHGLMVSALMASTDRLATLNVDLNALLRQFNEAAAADPEGDRAALHALIKDIRAHLMTAAPVRAEVRRFRRPQ